MTDSQEVVLELATLQDSEVLSNLVELYAHDLSDVFALITRGSPASDDIEAFDVAEFFVVRRHRRSGVGQCAAFLLWNRFAVRWIVRVSEGNHAGCCFWASVIGEYTDGAFEETTRPSSAHAWRVFSFNSLNRSAIVSPG